MTSRRSRPTRKCPRIGQSGFSLIELMVALTVLLAGIGGVLSMQFTALRATSYSRHATEAAILGEDKMEEFRTVPIEDIVDGSEQVDAQGRPGPDGVFTRSWTIEWNGDVATLIVRVGWSERGDEKRSLVFAALRSE